MATIATLPGASAPQNPYSALLWPDSQYSPVLARLIRATNAATVLADVLLHDDEIRDKYAESDADDDTTLPPFSGYIRGGLSNALRTVLCQICIDVEFMQKREDDGRQS
jgi:hypothetical protein